MMKQALSIQELWEQICNSGDGDDAAIEIFIFRFDKAIQARCRLNGTVNEDLVQDVRAKLYKQIKDYQKKMDNG